jgi:HlyD family secretion protein
MIEHNSLRISARPQVITGCLTLVLLIGGLGVWAVRATLTAAVVSSGIVEVESNRQIVQHPVGGVVAEIYARDGQYVAAGEVLLRLDAERQRAELVFAEAQLFELVARQNRLKAEQLRREDVIFDLALVQQSVNNPALQAMLIGQRQLFHATRLGIRDEVAKLESRKDQIAAQITGIEAQSLALLRQLEIAGVD